MKRSCAVGALVIALVGCDLEPKEGVITAQNAKAIASQIFAHSITVQTYLSTHYLVRDILNHPTEASFIGRGSFSCKDNEHERFSFQPKPDITGTATLKDCKKTGNYVLSITGYLLETDSLEVTGTGTFNEFTGRARNLIYDGAFSIRATHKVIGLTPTKTTSTESFRASGSLTARWDKSALSFDTLSIEEGADWVRYSGEASSSTYGELSLSTPKDITTIHSSSWEGELLIRDEYRRSSVRLVFEGDVVTLQIDTDSDGKADHTIDTTLSELIAEALE